MRQSLPWIPPVLMTPSGVPLRDVCETTDMLLRAGATIDELNCVRKHLDRLKGGRLAQIAAPARVLALLLSYVLGDRPDVIASGPLSPDSTKFADALAIVDRHRVRDRISASALEISGVRDTRLVPESPVPEAPYFQLRPVGGQCHGASRCSGGEVAGARDVGYNLHRIGAARRSPSRGTEPAP